MSNHEPEIRFSLIDSFLFITHASSCDFVSFSLAFHMKQSLLNTLLRHLLPVIGTTNSHQLAPFWCLTDLSCGAPSSYVHWKCTEEPGTRVI